MVDVVDPLTRSRMMSGIRGKNTKPELRLRSELHRRGLRFRVHHSGLAGRPDLVFPRHKAVVFVHGCFWHRHEGCHWCTTPSSNTEFWGAKFASNLDRDRRNREALEREGWRIATAWECALRPAELDRTTANLAQWLFTEAPRFDTGLVRARAA